MLTGIPPSYVDVAQALATRGCVNVMGIVVDAWEIPFQCRNSSFCITFTIKDSDLDNGHTWDGLKVKYFRETEDQLPPVKKGDVVLLRDLWIKIMSGGPLGVASQISNIPWAVFRQGDDPMSDCSVTSGPIPFQPTYREKAYASSLLAASPTSFRTESTLTPDLAPAPVSKASTKRKFSLLKDVQDRQYVDLIGEIVKIHGNDSEKVTIYLTDYTSNENFFNYASDNDDNNDCRREGDEFNYITPQKRKWDGPSGQMTIQITLWEPHASAVRAKFNVEDIVLLKNVHIKGHRMGGSALEGAMHGNRQNPEGINVSRANLNNDPRAHQFLARRKEYWEAHPRQSKRKTEENDDKPSKKRANKKQNQKTQPKKETGQLSLPVTKQNPISRNVQTMVPAGVLSLPLERIIDNPLHMNDAPGGIKYRLPFQNLFYSTTVRIIDFFPPRLEDFAVLQKHVSRSYKNKHNRETYEKWEWRFCLYVEDAASSTPGQPRKRAKLWVSDESGQFLLKDNAVNLRERPHSLENLRQRLFLLWGELEEEKKKALEGKKPLDPASLSSLPINCCIKEYGVKCNHTRIPSKNNGADNLASCTDGECFGWERRFGLVKTTIHF
ncbi:hypothetical protein BJX61DRAFT_372823 [Aspergillus egyptiacus]|nr:hypothetical protein BJX61DRAFT_372823 [Aspergillus egyptiacus]